MALISCFMALINIIVFLEKNYVNCIAEFTRWPEDIIACEGDDILFDWQFNGSVNLIHFTKDTEDVLTVTTGPALHPPYVGRVKYNGNGNITLLKVTKTDSGDYLLELLDTIFDLSTYRSDNIKVTVFDIIKTPPVIQYNNTMNLLSCTLPNVGSGFSVSWQWENKSAEGVSIKPSTGGKYTCIVSGPAVNECLQHGINASSAMMLKIGKPVVRARFPVVKTRQYETVTLQCYSEESNPVLKSWKWQRAGTNAPILSEHATLNLRQVMMNDSGAYECRASNAIGESNPANIQLEVFVETLGKEEVPESQPEDKFPTLEVAIGAAAAAVTVMTAVLIIYIIRRRRVQKKETGKGLQHLMTAGVSDIEHTGSDPYDEIASTTAGNRSLIELHQTASSIYSSTGYADATAFDTRENSSRF